ncbi:S-layer homology domain-containing protein [Bacillus sp. FJAT-29790]|uniref:S-layer homology domain-containing protein n=1 Tax=Bacillus sp. FJAT-29790 TaxID=1895002 RepID=UPI001C21E5F3|nr:S-layer homology domain-containing protein [Bacillus sp. FJAT-29790]MBU8881108.1 S-layer homology domain-containing protein [Bacillus sp. FJAT-29790]
MFKSAAGAFVFLFVFLFSGQAQAHVIDETKLKQAAASYEDYYTLQQKYKGESGVTFESYSYKWKSIEQLKALEQELLANKHGRELSYLGKVVIYPDYPAGKNILGQYYASYEYGPNVIRYAADRKIELYGGNELTTPEQMATTLSHEYGHHFTYYHLIEGEKVLPDNWMGSEYAKARGLDKHSQAHLGDGAYIWNMAEIVAEDYVQLFGTENAIKTHMQMNGHIQSAFDGTGLMEYWATLLNDHRYSVVSPISMYVTGFQKQLSEQYDLQLYTRNLQNQSAYLMAQDSSFTYAPVQLTSWDHVPEQESWIRYRQLPASKAWVLDASRVEGMRLQAIQHQQEGFNRGSKTVTLNYANMNQSIQSKEQMNALEAKQYTIPEIKKILRETAVTKGIPAEILKAIAYVETGFKQFDANDQPIIADDGGIGMMQVTMTDQEMKNKGIDKEKLKWDIQYNIETGADILLAKWKLNIPTINHHDPNHLEDWYFAIMAYNGLSKRNDPNINQGKKPYQERVYDYIRGLGQLEIAATPTIDIRYPNPEAPDLIVFGDQPNYQWGSSTRTKQNLKAGDTVYTFNSSAYANLRDGVDGALSRKLNHYTPLQITKGPFETISNPNNQYVMYKVKGNGFEGYMASSNIIKAELKVFSDINREEVATAVAYLQVRNIINGYQDGTFKPDNALSRHNAAKLLVNALKLKLPEGYKMKATDMSPNHPGYEDMRIAEAHNLMGDGGKLRPDEFLSRSQMASILVRAFGDYYEKPTKDYPFTDIGPNTYNFENMNTLAHNKITISDPFRPNTSVTRSQFALFLERTIQLVEGKQE